jgi:hypothetical protein
MFSVFDFFLLSICAQQPLYTLTWKHQSFLYTAVVQTGDLGFPSFSVLFHTFISECDSTPLEYFYERSVQSNYKLAVS